MYRLEDRAPKVLLVHPGGPFWRNKDAHAWSIPKGEFGEDETPEAAALREFEEEVGQRLADGGRLVPLGDAVQSGQKRVTCFALEGDLDCARAASASIEMEWPPKSGRRIRFPEVDRAEWFGLAEAREKIIKGQAVFLDRLVEMLRAA